MSDRCNGCGQPGLRFVTHICPPPELSNQGGLCMSPNVFFPTHAEMDEINKHALEHSRLLNT